MVEGDTPADIRPPGSRQPSRGSANPAARHAHKRGKRSTDVASAPAGSVNTVLIGDNSGCARMAWGNLKSIGKRIGLNCFWIPDPGKVHELTSYSRIDVVIYDASPAPLQPEHIGELREAGRGAALIVLTEDDHPDTVRQLAALGIEDHLAKRNIRAATLERVIGHVIERRRFQSQIDASLRREQLRGRVLARIAESAPLPEVLGEISEGLRQEVSCADFGFAINAGQASGGLLLWPDRNCISAQLASRALAFAREHPLVGGPAAEGAGYIEPIINGDRLVGHLAMLPRPGMAVGDSLLAHARLAAELAALAVDRLQTADSLRQSQEELRLLSAQLLNIQEAERQRIAGDLHDVIGQSLSVVKVSIEEAQAQFERDGAGDAAAALSRLVPWVKQALAEVRRISMDLRPAIIDDLGLLPTLSWFFREFGASCRNIVIEPRISITESDVPPELKIGIFRILQEAVSNIIKHADAKHIRVVLQRTDSIVQLAVIDDGKGFDADAPATSRDWKSGLGLASMRERARVSGGNYIIESTPGAGTRVFVSWYRPG
jgi:signal transduction histidine kinase